MAFVENSHFMKNQNLDCNVDLNDSIHIEGHPLIDETRRKIQIARADIY